jgi:hypothetical protein
MEDAATYSLYESLLKLLKSFKNFDSLDGRIPSFYFPFSTSARLTYDYRLPTSKPSWLSRLTLDLVASNIIEEVDG